MTKFYLEKRGHKKSFYFITKTTSDSNAKKLKREGIKIYNSRDEALEEIRKK